MNMKLLSMVGILSFALCGCQNSNKNKNQDVISQRYIHKYGYDVSRDEWNANRYPGQVVTTLKNGVTIASSYEDGVLHGPTSYTYSHSQTMESLQIYDRGNLIKKTTFDIKGVPQKEEIFLTPTHVKAQSWYTSGTPMYFEEYVGANLIQGDYFNLQNECESRVENGMGLRTIRSKEGELLARESIERGQIASHQTFHPYINTPHITTRYENGVLEGERAGFGPSGEPLFIEHYSKGQLDGLATYFQNGCKYMETFYQNGKKEGIERQYIDGEILVEETEYHVGVKHGPSIFYSDGISKTEWYYNNHFVSKSKFDDLMERERVIAIMHERAAKAKNASYDDLEDEDSFLEFENP